MRGLNQRVVDAALQQLGIFIRRWVGRDEFGAGVEEELFECGNAFVTINELATAANS